MKDYVQHFCSNSYGFLWNNMKVTRICADRRFGSILEIKTDKQIMVVRVTDGGKIKAEPVVKLNERAKK